MRNRASYRLDDSAWAKISVPRLGGPWARVRVTTRTGPSIFPGSRRPRLRNRSGERPSRLWGRSRARLITSVPLPRTIRAPVSPATPLLAAASAPRSSNRTARLEMRKRARVAKEGDVFVFT